MTERQSPARRLRGGVAPVLDEASERARRERIAARVVDLSRELSSQRARRRRWLLGVALAALVGSASAALLVWRPAPEDVTIAGVPLLEMQLLAGRASVRSGDDVVPLAEGSVQLAPDAELVTRADEGAELRLASSTEVSVAPASQVSIRRERSSPESFEERVRLRTGSVALAVPKLGTRGTVCVETADALVEVHGTRFSVRVVEAPPGAPFTEVSVTEGRVLVRSGGQSRLLGPGESTSTRVAAANPPGMPPIAVPQIAQPEVMAPESLRRPDRRRPPSRPVPPSELAEQNRLLEAAELAQRSGMPALALERLERLIGRYPDAELSHNARVERFRVLERAGRHAEAVAAARAYIARHPEGFAREEAQHLIDGGP